MENANGNGGTEVKEGSALSKVIKVWRDKGKKLPDDATRKKLVVEFAKLKNAADAAEKAYNDANAALSSFVETKMIPSFGDTPIKSKALPGRYFKPMSRGTSLFYREFSDEQAISDE